MNKQELALFNNLEKFMAQMAADMKAMREILEQLNKKRFGF